MGEEQEELSRVLAGTDLDTSKGKQKYQVTL